MLLPGSSVRLLSESVAAITPEFTSVIVWPSNMPAPEMVLLTLVRVTPDACWVMKLFGLSDKLMVPEPVSVAPPDPMPR
jgi:hypothetical protein